MTAALMFFLGFFLGAIGTSFCHDMLGGLGGLREFFTTYRDEL